MVDRLKIDQTAIQTNNRYVLISNVNIPVEYLTVVGDGGGGGGGEVAKRELLERVNQFIRAEYTHTNPVYFEVTATYQLKHRDTNNVRQWLGSFAPRIGPMLFDPEIYSEATFVRKLVNTLDVEQISVKLLHMNGLDSDWVFDKLYSVIIHISSLVPKEYHILYRRNLFHQGRRTTRKVATFDLP